MLAALATVGFFVASGLTAARTAQALGPARANLLRLAVAFAVLGLWALVFGSGLGGPAMWIFVASGLVGFGLGDAGLFEAYARIGSRRTLLLTHVLAAPLAAVAELLWLGQGLTLRQSVCVGVILAGVLVALRPSHATPLPRRAFAIGVAFGLLAAAGQGLGAVISRKAFAVAAAGGFAVDPLTATFERLLGGIVIAVLVALVRGGAAARAPLGAVPLGTLVLVNAMAGPVLGVASFQYALSTTPSPIVLAIVATTPLVAMPLAWWTEGDRPTRATILGGILAVAGVAGLFLQWPVR